MSNFINRPFLWFREVSRRINGLLLQKIPHFISRRQEILHISYYQERRDDVIAYVGILLACGGFGQGVAFNGEFVKELDDAMAEEGDRLGREEVWDDEVTIVVEFGDVDGARGALWCGHFVLSHRCDVEAIEDLSR
jgi:hypothetical protein